METRRATRVLSMFGFIREGCEGSKQVSALNQGSIARNLQLNGIVTKRAKRNSAWGTGGVLILRQPLRSKC